jgi:hypothetical protein
MIEEACLGRMSPSALAAVLSAERAVGSLLACLEQSHPLVAATLAAIEAQEATRDLGIIARVAREQLTEGPW